MITYGSVCSGIEAATVGWHHMGWKPAWFAQFDPEHDYAKGPDFPSAVLAHHYPQVPNLGNMTTIAERVLRGEIEAPDVLTGGTPCQAFSTAGLRKGLNDDRGKLTLSFCELANAIDTVRQAQGKLPVTIIWENVPGVLSDKTNAFGCFLAGLAGDAVPCEAPKGKWKQCGVVVGAERLVAWRILDAQFLGVAQRRRRVWVVSIALRHPGAWSGIEALLPLCEGVCGDIAPSRETREEAASSVEAGTTTGSHWDNLKNAHPSLSQSHNTGGIGLSNQELFAQHGAGLVPVSFIGGIDNENNGFAADGVCGPLMKDSPTGGGRPLPAIVYGFRMEAFGKYVDDNSASTIKARDYKDATDLITSVAGASSHTLKGKGFEGSEDGTGRGTPIIAMRESGQGYWMRDNIAGTLRAEGENRPSRPSHVIAFHAEAEAQAKSLPTETRDTSISDSPSGGGRPLPAIVYGFHENQRAEVTIFDVMGSLKCAGGKPGQGYPAIAYNMQVRRLTPIECARLQGFPDHYLDITFRKKPAPEGHKYKALGNSWAVPCSSWLGQRIDAVLNNIPFTHKNYLTGHRTLPHSMSTLTTQPLEERTPMTTPPFNPAVFGGAPPPPPQMPAQPVQPAPITDADLLPLVKTKVVFGKETVQNADQQQWALGLLKQKIPDLRQLHGMLTNSTTIDIQPLWEEQQAHAASSTPAPVNQPAESVLNPAVTTPPPNPISDSSAPQVAAPPPADAPPAPGSAASGPEQEAEPAAWDRISGTQCKSLRGLKSRLSKTHKVDWKDYCTRFNLNKETGLEAGPAPVQPPAPAGSEIPGHAAPASPGIPLQTSAEGNRQASLPPAPESPQFGTAAPVTPATPPAPVTSASLFQKLPSLAYVGSEQPGADYATACKQGIPMLLVWAGGDPIASTEVEEAYDWLFGAFTGIDGVRPTKQSFQIYCWLTDLHQKGQKGELVPLAPAKRSQNLAPQQFQTPAAAPASEVPMFAPPQLPPAAPTPVQTEPAPAVPEQLALDLVSAAAGGQFGSEVQTMTQGMLQPHAQQPTAPPAAPAGMAAYSSRQELAHMLGGAVDCVFVPLIEAANIDLAGRVDANQLAGLCEMEALRQVTDPQDLKFRKDRAVAEQIFMGKLSENPKLYVLIQGWDWVLPENLVPILLRRVCSGGIMKNGGYLAFNF